MKTSSLPHIILIILDTAGAKRCSVYGYPRETTPGLSRLAEEATLYKNCFAPAPWTIPSHASLFSGLYPSQHGCDEFHRDLPEGVYNLPEIMRQLGYRTFAISSNLLLSPRGFDRFFSMHQLFNNGAYKVAQEAIKSFKKESKSDLERLKFLIRYAIKNNFYSLPFMNLIDRFYKKNFAAIGHKSQHATERTFRLAKKIIRRCRCSNEGPIFIFINVMEPHWKYNPPSNYVKKLNISKQELREILKLYHYDLFLIKLSESLLKKVPLLYEQTLHYISDKILNLYHYLKTVLKNEEALFIVTSDHGEAHGEHGLWGHNFGLYNEVTHIPLIIKYPKDVGLAGEVTQLSQLHDLYATIMEVTQSPFPVPETSQSLLSEPRCFALSEHFSALGLQALLRREPSYQSPKEMQPCRAIVNTDL